MGQVPVCLGAASGLRTVCVWRTVAWAGSRGRECLGGWGVRLSLQPVTPSVGPGAGPALLGLAQGAHSAREASSGCLLLPPGAPQRGFQVRALQGR